MTDLSTGFARLGTALLALALCGVVCVTAQAKDAQKDSKGDSKGGSKGDSKGAKEQDAKQGEDGKADPDAPLPRCEIQVELLAVVLEERDHERSFAMVADKGKKPRMVGVGSWVGDRSVRAIEPRAIWLSDAAGLCWLPLERGATARPAATSRPGNPDAAEERRRKRAEQRAERRAARRKQRPSVDKASND
jgi:hypothetical protein